MSEIDIEDFALSEIAKKRDSPTFDSETTEPKSQTKRQKLNKER